MLLRYSKQPKDFYRLVDELGTRGHRKSATLNLKAIDFSAKEISGSEGEGIPALLFSFKRCTEYSCKISNFFRGQIVMLHEPLNAKRSCMFPIAHPSTNFCLNIKSQAIFTSPCDIVKMRSYGPKKVLCFGKPFYLISI